MAVVSHSYADIGIVTKKQHLGRTINGLMVVHEANGPVQCKVNLCTTVKIGSYYTCSYKFKRYWGGRSIYETWCM